MTRQVWLGADPGSSNFAVSVFRFDTETGKTKLLYAGMIANPIKNLTATPSFPKKRKTKPKAGEDRTEPALDVGLRLFADEVEWILKTFGVTHFAGERFQARGKFMGDTIEAVSMMMGIICYMCHRRNIKFMTTTAGVWKNAMARLGGDLFSLYEDGIIELQKALKNAGLPAAKKDAEKIVHIIDSALIALWHADRDRLWANSTLLRVLAKKLSAAVQ